MSCGIYYLKINNKFYIGQSIDIEHRFSNHLSELRNNHHYSQKLQNAFNEYGESNLTKGILEECDAKDLDEKEKFYIDKYDSFNNGYNGAPGGQTQQPWYSLNKKVYVFTRDKKPVMQFDTARECARQLEIDQSLLCKVLLRKKKNAKSFKYNYYFLYSYEPEYDGIIQEPLTKVKIRIEKDNFTKEFDTITSALKFLGCSGHTLAVKGKIKEINGYKVTRL